MQVMLELGSIETPYPQPPRLEVRSVGLGVARTLGELGLLEEKPCPEISQNWPAFDYSIFPSLIPEEAFLSMVILCRDKAKSRDPLPSDPGERAKVVRTGQKKQAAETLGKAEQERIAAAGRGGRGGTPTLPSSVVVKYPRKGLARLRSATPKDGKKK